MYPSQSSRTFFLPICVILLRVCSAAVRCSRGVESGVLTGEEGVGGTVELVAALEEVELHEEDESKNLTADLGDEVAGCCSAATWISLLV